jgi:Flp pilus assembly protein TadG
VIDRTLVLKERRLRHSKRKKYGRRKGYVLVLVVLLLIGLMAMAALVIDIGFARLTQRQLQSGSDSATLEGLRGRGTVAYGQRQTNAAQFVAWQFDDDLSTANGDTGIAGDGNAFGAGPLVEFTGGVGDSSIVASQLMSIDEDNKVYKPVLELGVESSDGFNANFLRGGAIDRNFDLVAHGPAVPYLFARGSLVDRERIARGMTVGATSRAIGRPVVAVGASTPSFPPLLPYAFEQSTWQSTGPSASDALSIVTSSIDLTRMVRIGSPIVIDTNVTPTGTGICVIYRLINGVNRVVGFGWIESGLPTPGVVVPGNASASFSVVMSQLLQLSTSDRNAILELNQTLISGLLAPVHGN